MMSAERYDGGADAAFRASRATLMFASSGSGVMTKPSSTHIRSIVVFSFSTWPSMVRRPSAAGVLDHRLHQQPAEPVTLEVRADQDGKFGGVVGRVRVQAATPSISPDASSMAMKAMARA